jgi:hypothetical protein
MKDIFLKVLHLLFSSQIQYFIILFPIISAKIANYMLILKFNFLLLLFLILLGLFFCLLFIFRLKKANKSFEDVLFLLFLWRLLNSNCLLIILDWLSLILFLSLRNLMMYHVFLEIILLILRVYSRNFWVFISLKCILISKLLIVKLRHRFLLIFCLYFRWFVFNIFLDIFS